MSITSINNKYSFFSGLIYDIILLKVKAERSP